jgi:hypothetical protein
MLHIKLLERLPIHAITKSLPTKSNPEIELKKFINFDLDCVGWYAIGHYNSKDFLLSLSKKGVDIKSHSKINYLMPVQRIWVKIDSSRIELADSKSEGVVPITFVEPLYD